MKLLAFIQIGFMEDDGKNLTRINKFTIIHLRKEKENEDGK